MNNKHFLCGVALGAATVLASVGPAFAGEVGGSGKETPAGVKAKSLCAFNGLEDNDGAFVTPGVSQAFGQLVKAYGPLGGANYQVTPFGIEGCQANIFPNK